MPKRIGYSLEALIGNGMRPELLYVLVLFAAAAHAIWNGLVKRAADALLMMAAIRLVGLVFGLCVVPFVPWPSGSTWILLCLACVATFAYYGLLIQSYEIGDLSLVYPIARGSAPVLLTLIAFVAIDEHLASTQFAGIILISAGILVLVIGQGTERRALGYALATGISIAAYSFLGGLGVRSSASVLGFQAWLEILTGIGVLAFAMVRRPGHIGAFAQTSGGIGIFAGALSVGGYLAFLTAAKVLPIAPIAALRECSLIFGTVIGAVLFKEGFGTRRILAATLVAAGVIAIAAPAFQGAVNP
jgi:drug/metabolite transporter (DMT)-like permease